MKSIVYLQIIMFTILGILGIMFGDRIEDKIIGGISIILSIISLNVVVRLNKQ